MSPNWKVTYFNPMLGKRCDLIDNVDSETADGVIARFGDGGDEFCRLPEVRKEPQGEEHGG
jgi:hypothetical protein